MNDSTRSRSHRLSERLLDLLNLLEGRRWSQKDLLDHLGIDRKTLRSNIEAINLIWAQVEEVREGRNVYYTIREFKSPSLTLREATIIVLAQEAIGATGLLNTHSPFAPHARSLLQKVRKSLPRNMRERLDATARVYGAATAPAKDFARHRETIDLLVDAALRRVTVRMQYYTLTTDKPSERDFDPYAVYFDPDGATLKVIGWDHKRKAIIPFAIDHIRGLKLTRRIFLRGNFDLRQHLETYCFNGIHGDPITVRLRAFEATARVFAERKFHPSQRLLPGPPGTTTIEMRVARGRGLERFILSWVPDIEVLSPATLREEIATAIRKGAERNKR